MTALRSWLVVVLVALVVVTQGATPAQAGKNGPSPGAARVVRPSGPAAAAIAEGDEAVLLGDLAAARAAYEAALVAQPDEPVATLRLAFVEQRSGNPGRALELLGRVASAADAPVEALLLVGALRAERGEWAEAAAAYEAVIKREPNDVAGHLGLARAAAKLEPGKTDGRAVAEYERCLVLLGDDQALRNQVQEELLVVKYGAAGRAFMEARNAYAGGDYLGAVSKLEGVVAQHPEIEEAQYLLGMAYATPDVNKRGKALAAWQKAPRIKEARLRLAVEWQADGDLDKAERAAKDALKLDEAFQAAWYQLGVIYAEGGKVDQAVGAWESAVALDPQSELGKWAATKRAMLAAEGASGGTFQEGQVFDPASETAMGHRFEEMALVAFDGILQDDKLTERLNKIWTRLVAASDRGDIPYKLYLVNTTVVNAFTAPGGRVFITRGLIDAIRNKMGDRDELFAAVLGHELAHAALRHMSEKWKYAQTIINDPKASKEEVGRAMRELMTGMTRQSEYEADQYGALYMYRAGYNPRFAIELHARFRAEFGEIPPGLDHPPFAEREARLRDFLIELRGRVREFERGNKKLAAGDYVGAGRSYEIFLAVLPKSAPGHLNLGLARHRQALARLGAEQKWKRTIDFDPDSRAAPIELHSSGKGGPALDPRLDRALLREAMAEYHTALRLDSQYTLARVNLGALLMDLADVKNATGVLERATKDTPGDARAWNNLGVAYAMARQDKKALAALAQASKVDDKLADPWFNVGVVHADAGRRDDAQSAFARYATLDPASGWTRRARELAALR